MKISNKKNYLIYTQKEYNEQLMLDGESLPERGLS